MMLSFVRFARFSQRPIRPISKVMCISRSFSALIPKEIIKEFTGAGVLRTDKPEDIRLLILNYTAPALASALRDREDSLQLASKLLADNNLDALKSLLSPHNPDTIQRRRKRVIEMNLKLHGFTSIHTTMIRKYLSRMPRQVSTPHQKRASVILPLCNSNGVPSVLFEKRSINLRNHPGEICFPGGMASGEDDNTIIDSALREMSEEIGLPRQNVNILGILRCNWSEVTAITGVAVTPVVGFIGELEDYPLKPNADEVDEVFTVPLHSIVDKANWGTNEVDGGVVFTGHFEYRIWGLTGYILHKFMTDVLSRYKIVT